MGYTTTTHFGMLIGLSLGALSPLFFGIDLVLGIGLGMGFGVVIGKGYEIYRNR